MNSQARVILETPLTDRVKALSAEPVIEDLSAISMAALQQKTVSLGSIDPPLHALSKHWFKPALVVLSLGVCLLITSAPLHLSYLCRYARPPASSSRTAIRCAVCRSTSARLSTD